MGWETEAQSLHLKGEGMCLFGLAKMSPPLYSVSSPGVATGWADSCSEILCVFFISCSPYLRGTEGDEGGSLSRNPFGEDDKSPELRPISSGTNKQVAVQETRDRYCHKHSRGYNEGCTKQTGESRPDKQFHFQSSAESEIASLRPAGTYRCWTQWFRD